MVTSKNLSLLFDNFNQLTPYAVGFDRQFNRLNDYVAHQQTSTGFPPYNIRKEGDLNHVIEMALAGFSKDDIEVEVAQGVLMELHQFKVDFDVVPQVVITKNYAKKSLNPLSSILFSVSHFPHVKSSSSQIVGSPATHSRICCN